MANNKRDVHVVFLGPTGCGKSRLCNFLLNDDKAFQVSASFKSVTKGIQAKWQSVQHKDELIVFKFIDTQGLADTTMTNAEVINVVKEAIKADVTYVNYFVIMLKPGRLTNENRAALEYIIKAFKLNDPERRKHVFLLLTHCECSSEALRKTYEKECLADPTIKQILVVNNNKIENCNFTGLPQPGEVNDWMIDGIMKWMEVQRKQLMYSLCEPIEGITPTDDSLFGERCTIL